jgi:tRNA 2-thiouridine synthesizing protein A
MAATEVGMATIVGARLDVSGMCCPIPLIQLAKTVKNLKPGQTLEITGNDPIFETSVRDFCQANGHTVLKATAGENHRVTVLIGVSG